jgi:hypothetical protein
LICINPALGPANIKSAPPVLAVANDATQSLADQPAHGQHGKRSKGDSLTMILDDRRANGVWHKLL